MGTNAVRLVHADHRRIGELVRRLGRPYRAGQSLRVQAGGELRAHVQATRDVLLPFAVDRRATSQDDVDRHGALLDELLACADELDHADDPVPAGLARRLALCWDRHVEHEQPLIDGVAEVVDVHRLRILGDALRRTRDSALRTALRGTSRLTRPVTTRAELYERARRRGIEGRSSMSRSELERALQRQEGA